VADLTFDAPVPRRLDAVVHAMDVRDAPRTTPAFPSATSPRHAGDHRPVFATPADMQIDIVGVPLDFGSGRRGVDMGPSAIRYGDLRKGLEALGHQVTDYGNLAVPVSETCQVGDPSLRVPRNQSCRCSNGSPNVWRAVWPRGISPWYWVGTIPRRSDPLPGRRATGSWG
jgi:hypothetical protein